MISRSRRLRDDGEMRMNEGHSEKIKGKDEDEMEDDVTRRTRGGGVGRGSREDWIIRRRRFMTHAQSYSPASWLTIVYPFSSFLTPLILRITFMQSKLNATLRSISLQTSKYSSPMILNLCLTLYHPF